MKRVFVGLSGGVDSAVSAALLKRAGYDVTGVFIKTWIPFDETQGKPLAHCTWREEKRDAMRVALALDMPFLSFDFEEEYKRGVANQMIEEYRLGRTPNPDILCNREIKFGAFWRKAREQGADYIATGHYARITPPTPSYSKRGQGGVKGFSLQFLLGEGADKEKDQSYFLWTLTQEDLAHTLFPIGHLEKGEVRRLAREFDLPVADKKDSQGICFIGEVDMDEFLSHYIESEPGNVLNAEGEAIGTHKGALYYTIGERHGFEIAKKGPDDKPHYVVFKDMETNTITVSNEAGELEALSPRRVAMKDVNWITKSDGPKTEARIRYRGDKLPVKIVSEHGVETAEFSVPVRGLSVGQSIVFYNGSEVLGGAVTDKIVV